MQASLLQRHRETQSANTSLTGLLGEDDAPERIQTDQRQHDGAAIWECPSRADVVYQQMISTARCHNGIEQSHRPTRRHEQQQQGFKRQNERRGC
ncbi:hypothetical protein ACFFLM_11760 [Deinococcus oregonensis]|uniref:Transposase n=1 Tax=Deinococcus oregonensis TaxID=1805970 RepID=A0ABV6AYT9_9DEIO